MGWAQSINTTRETPMQPSSIHRLMDLFAPSIIRPTRAPLIVLSHLRWGFVFQRPQHLLTRLATEFDIYFIEEPVFHEGEPHLRSARHDGIEVLTPHTAVRAPGFHDD